METTNNIENTQNGVIENKLKNHLNDFWQRANNIIDLSDDKGARNEVLLMREFEKRLGFTKNLFNKKIEEILEGYREPLTLASVMGNGEQFWKNQASDDYFEANAA